MRGCPATRRFYHVFDKTTHRCKCGRWERGYAPKKAPVCERAECQICERQQAVKGGLMVHHGYQRPGDGQIHGDCYGVGHLPYPDVTALRKYEIWLVGEVRRLKRVLVGLDKVTSLPFIYKEGFGRNQVEKVADIVKDQPLPHCGNYCVPSFESLLERKRTQITSALHAVEGELRRVEKRILNAK